MAVAHDATTNFQDWGLSSFSFSHTAGASANYLEIKIGYEQRTRTIDAITYNGVSILANLRYTAEESGNGGKVSVYDLVAPPTGTRTVAITFSTNVQAVISASTYTGVDQTTPRGAEFELIETGSSNAPSVTVTDAVAGDIISDVLAVTDRTATITVGANQNEIANVQNSASAPGIRLGCSWQDPADGGVMSWSIGSNESYVLIAGAIKATAVSGSKRLTLLGVG